MPSSSTADRVIKTGVYDVGVTYCAVKTDLAGCLSQHVTQWRYCMCENKASSLVITYHM